MRIVGVFPTESNELQSQIVEFLAPLKGYTRGNIGLAYAGIPNCEGGVFGAKPGDKINRSNESGSHPGENGTDYGTVIFSTVHPGGGCK